jgi:hypothetical protein
MAAIPTAAQPAFRLDHGAAMQAFRAGVVPSRAQSRDANWLRWVQYCSNMGFSPTLHDNPDPITALQVFAHRYRTGTIAPSGQPVRSRTVEAALRAVGQTLASMGSPDPRLDSTGSLHYILQQQLRGYARQDPVASRVKPVPFSIIEHLQQQAATPKAMAIADMAILGFFFLLRPGEHTLSNPTSDSQPFTLQDVTFRAGGTLLHAPTGDIPTISTASFVTLRFTRQKNGTENEIIGHARSGHSTVCPVKALIRRVLYLRKHQALPATPLCTVYSTLTPSTVSSQQLTAALRQSATFLFPVTGFPPADISARALRAGGAMALLCARVDDNIIKLVGRWRSDQMLRYLHLQAYPHMHTFANLMVTGGSFRLLHRQTIPNAAVPLLAQAPLAPDDDDAASI